MSFPRSNLPPALWELTLAAQRQGTPRRQTTFVRYASAAATLAVNPGQAYSAPLYPHLTKGRKGDGRQVARFKAKTLDKVVPRKESKQAQGGQLIDPSVLEKHVADLGEIAEQQELAAEPPTYSESDLMLIYQDLLALPAEPETATTQTAVAAEAEEDTRLLQVVEARMRNTGVHSNYTGLAGQLRGESDEGVIQSQEENAVDGSMSLHQRILLDVRRVADRLKQAKDFFNAGSSVSTSSTLPIGVLSKKEWYALVRDSLRVADASSSETAMMLMKECGMEPEEALVNDVLKFHSRELDLRGFQSCLSKFSIGPPTEIQRHLHVKTYLRLSNPHEIPTAALSLLHSYEQKSTPAPLKTYSTAIAQLMSVPSSLARAQAWDLFSHMRYVAHPDPDVRLYTTMIRACASPVSPTFSSEPERALDLWTEMVFDHQLTPTTGAYNAIILACAKSGRKQYVAEAFRLAKEMMDSHRDSEGRMLYKPDRQTFAALLEGAKRVGDLARSRWILAEMVRLSEEDEHGDLEIDSHIMMHVFHAYASYTPPFKRSLAKMQDDPEDPQPEDQVFPVQEDSSQALRQAEMPLAGSSPAFLQAPPQSRIEVLAEAKTLFERVVSDESGSSSERFGGVEVTPKLVSAYLSVFYRHDSLENCRHVFTSIFERFGLERTPRVLVEALNRCAFASKSERSTSLDFGKQLMAEWMQLENGPARVDPRLVEKAHILYIRLLSQMNELDQALSHLHSFCARYPPSSVRQPASKPAMRATRTSLVGARPLVRLTSATELPDDTVPPLLTFKDLELLHHRLAAAGRSEVGYIKYVAKSYIWALRVRRDEALKAKPEKEDHSPLEDAVTDAA